MNTKKNCRLKRGLYYNNEKKTQKNLSYQELQESFRDLMKKRRKNETSK